MSSRAAREPGEPVRRFSGTQITTMVVVVAAAAAVIAFPVGVYAATGSLVNITDPTYAARKAHVSSAGHLLSTVDGTVSSRPVPPTGVWSVAIGTAGPSPQIRGATASTFNITSLTATVPANGAEVSIVALDIPGNASTCLNIQSTRTVYAARNLNLGNPLTVAFPTPLQIRPKAGMKQCLVVNNAGGSFDVSGYTS